MLRSTGLRGVVKTVLVNRDRESSLTSERVDRVAVSYAGFEGEAHGGLTRKSCVRVKAQYPQGTEIRNVRQISVLGAEELDRIAEKMEIDRVEPEWVGANLVLRGIPSLTLLPPSTRLLFEGGVSLVVDMENGPCRFPGEVIDTHFPGRGARFPKAAQHLRGVTAWVEKEGAIAAGEAVDAHLPIQPRYPHLPG